MLASMSLIAFLFVPVLFVDGFIEIQQTITSMKRTSLLLEINDKIKYYNISVELAPRKPKVARFALREYRSNVNFSIYTIDESNLMEPHQKRLTTLLPVQVGATFESRFVDKDDIDVIVMTTFKCAQNYTGPQCEHKCDSEALKSSRKRCDNSMHIRCDYGWMGEQCSQVVDPRKCECMNAGICVSSLQFGFNATSEESLVCECSPGFSGSKCDIAQSNAVAPRETACNTENVCLNGGECFANGPKPFCACQPGFVGNFCELKVSTDAPVESFAPANSIYIIIVIVVAIAVIIGCCTYKRKSNPDRAYSRGPLEEAYPVRHQKRLPNLLKTNEPSKCHKVYTIQDSTYATCDEIYEERYTAGPVRSTYSMIQKPSLPTQSPPPTPIYP